MEKGELVTCDTCKAEYAPVQKDGTSYTHVCNDEVVTVRAKFDASGKQIVEEVRKKR